MEKDSQEICFGDVVFYAYINSLANSKAVD